VADLAPRLVTADLVAVVDHCMGNRLAQPSTIRRRVEALGLRRPGAARLLEVLDRRFDGQRVPHGEFEHRLLELLATLPGPPPVTQFRIVTPDGKERFLDAAWPDELFGIEADSYKHHAIHGGWERDHTRVVPILGMGWRIFPVTWFDITQRPDWWLDHLVLARAAR
jgi:hypothetical protein